MRVAPTPKPLESIRPSLALAADLGVAPPSRGDGHASSSLLDLGRVRGAIIRSIQVVSTLLFLVATSVASAAPLPGLPELKAAADQLVPTPVAVDVAGVPASEKKALARLVQAARILDPLFVRQSWAGSEAWMMKLARDTSPLAQARLRLFLLNQGPWDRLAHDAAFLPGVPEKPASGNFYPAGASKEDVSRWLSTLSPEERRRASSFFTTIRRAPNGGFTIVPYSLEYQGELARASALLREAAAATAQPALRSFLEARAAALLSD
ncbi:MAG TPA: hypothetical protein VGF31_09190, partial [Myxococcaceae bacterium]